MPDDLNPGPMQLDPQAVIDELEAMPEARPYWALAQERAARKTLQRQLQEQTAELEQLRNGSVQRNRDLVSSLVKSEA